MSDDEIRKVRNAEKEIQRELSKRLKNIDDTDLKFIYIVLQSILERVEKNYELSKESSERIKGLDERLNKISRDRGI